MPGRTKPRFARGLKLRAGDRFSFFRWQDDRDRLELFYQQRDRAAARVTTRRVAAGDA